MVHFGYQFLFLGPTNNIVTKMMLYNIILIILPLRIGGGNLSKMRKYVS
jgi:hypothetical protein